MRCFKSCDQVDLQNLKPGQELYTDPRGINMNGMLLIGQLMLTVTPRKGKKNTYTYYKRAKEQSTSGGHYHQIIFLRFCFETNTEQENCLFCVIQSSLSNTVFLNKFVNARYNGVFSIGYLNAIVNPDPIED